MTQGIDHLPEKTPNAYWADLASREYLALRDEMTRLRTDGGNLVAATGAGLAVSLSGLAVFRADQHLVGMVLLFGAFLLGLISVAQIGIAGSMKFIEGYTLRLAVSIRQTMATTGQPLPPWVLGFPIAVYRFDREHPPARWTISFGALGFAGFIPPIVGVIAGATGGYLALQNIDILVVLMITLDLVTFASLIVLAYLSYRERLHWLPLAHEWPRYEAEFEASSDEPGTPG